MKSQKTPLFILITYIIMYFSPFLVVRPIASIIKSINPDLNQKEFIAMTQGWTTFSTFLVGLLVVVFFILRDKNFLKNGFKSGERASTPVAIGWGILGFFIVLAAQMLGGIIETSLGIKAGSENTEILSTVAAVSPIIIFSIVFFGPFLEEVVFRRIIFGSLNQTTNFWIATLVSAVVFGLIHNEFSHLILYTSTGLVFAFLYNKTKRLLTTVISHMMLNGFVMLIQLNQDKIMEFIKQAEKLQP